jgi:hypothetical protein
MENYRGFMIGTILEHSSAMVASGKHITLEAAAEIVQAWPRQPGFELTRIQAAEPGTSGYYADSVEEARQRVDDHITALPEYADLPAAIRANAIGKTVGLPFGEGVGTLEWISPASDPTDDNLSLYRLAVIRQGRQLSKWDCTPVCGVCVSSGGTDDLNEFLAGERAWSSLRPTRDDD